MVVTPTTAQKTTPERALWARQTNEVFDDQEIDTEAILAVLGIIAVGRVRFGIWQQ